MIGASTLPIKMAPCCVRANYLIAQDATPQLRDPAYLRKLGSHADRRFGHSLVVTATTANATINTNVATTLQATAIRVPNRRALSAFGPSK